MRILILNQTFYPDVVSTAQHAADLARGLSDAGHEVTVLASRRAYDSPARLFPARECWRGIEILRAPSTALGKSALWRRAVDFASFLLACMVRLAPLPRFDVVIAMTSPPLIATLAALFVRVKGGALVSWIMDLNPDEAIAAGALRAGSLPARALACLLRFSLATSSAVVVLDRFMRDRIVAKGVPESRIAILPPWAHAGAVRYHAEGREQFRRTHGLDGKLVVMYSGNHSPCHPLDTVLEAARALRAENDIAFVFVGGGSEFRQVAEFAKAHALPNILCLPYQPLAGLSASLSAADLHLVVMGDPFVGIVHPCKIYNILTLGIPCLYVGPQVSHIADLACDAVTGVRHGDVAGVIRAVRAAAPRREPAVEPAAALPQMIAIIENAGQSGADGIPAAEAVS